MRSRYREPSTKACAQYRLFTFGRSLSRSLAQKRANTIVRFRESVTAGTSPGVIETENRDEARSDLGLSPDIWQRGFDAVLTDRSPTQDKSNTFHQVAEQRRAGIL